MDTEEVNLPSSPSRFQYMREVGARLRARRVEIKMDIHELSWMAGIPDTLISDLEDGKKTGSFWTIANIATCLELSLDKLVEDIEF